MNFVDQRRRQLMAAGIATMVPPRLSAKASAASQSPLIARAIPRGGETIPVIGMGTWLTFDIGSSSFDLARRKEVVRNFLAAGGRVIDSSPMYGRAEAVVGELLSQLDATNVAFAATKVWTTGNARGERQMEDSLRLWRRQKLDLEQIHNLVDWETHLVTLRRWKAEGRIRYLGATTSHGNKHETMEAAMTQADFDFVQFTYSFADRRVESRLLPLAAERRAAVIINRPFDGGALVDRLSARPLPGWAAEIGCTSWAQVCLKWIVSHPAVTCAIPATSNPAHMTDNMRALRGPLPDAALRRRMADDVGRL
ncbi:MAG: aldo/keto reductase [Burkholderiaceae bacterium]